MAFYFAWVADGDTTFGVSHQVEDEEVFAFDVEHQEGDFPSLKIDIRNPRIGLLNAGRDLWAWLSWRKPDNSVVPLFHGRIVGIPEDIDKEIVTLEFSARPADYEDQKAALAESLKVAPYWDPIWIDEDELENPDVVLEARPQLWHIGRTDKLVTVSHILVPEAGQFAFDSGDVFTETLEIGYGADPIRHVHVEATVTWDQVSKGTIDLSQKIAQEFGSAPIISSYTGQGLEADWPRYGDGIGGGWSVGESFTRLLSGNGVPATYIKTDIDPSIASPGPGDIEIEDWWADSTEGYEFWYDKAVEEWIAQRMLDPIREARFYLWVFVPTFEADYETSRNRKEVLTFTVDADMQEMVVDEEAKTTEIKISSDRVSIADEAGVIPIGRLDRRTYFGLDRGKQSIEYLLALVRSRILISARAVEVGFAVSFEQATAMSCRHGVVLTLDDLPGGECEGKIIAYRFSLDGDTGELNGECTIGCSIGKGNSLPAPDDGDPTYVNENYVEDYQYYAGATFDSIPGELTYDSFMVVPVDDGINFENLTADNVIQDTPATALLTLSGPGGLDETVTVGARVYTLKSAVIAANRVLIGATAEATARNIADAINAAEGQGGITYGAGTVGHADVMATADNGIVRVTARIPGVVGNAIIVHETLAAGLWDNTHLYDGDDGLIVHNPPSVQASVLSARFPSVQAAIDALNVVFTEVELALKPVTGGPFETPIEITVSDLMVPKTIDLEAA